MKLKLFIILLLIAGSQQIKAQSLLPFVISSSGAFYSNASGMLSSTIGEMSMISTFTANNSILTQGFQQAFDFVNEVPQLTVPNALSIYPNPTSGEINIELPQSTSGNWEANVYDAMGRRIIKQIISTDGKASIYQMSLQHLSNGIYLVELISSKENYISKVNVIQ